MAAMFYKFQDLYHQYQRGVISEDAWIQNEMTIEGMMQNAAVAAWWDSRFFQASDKFRELVEKLRKNSEAEWQWVDIARVFDSV